MEAQRRSGTCHGIAGTIAVGVAVKGHIVVAAASQQVAIHPEINDVETVLFVMALLPPPS